MIPPGTPQITGGLRPPVAPLREDAAKTAAPPALWLGFTALWLLRGGVRRPDAPTAAPGRMIFMRLTVVGCAGSFPGPDSPASCYLLEADGFRVVIDLGNGSLGALQKYTSLFDIDAVCLSHLHADHCVDLYSYSVARSFSPAGPQPAIPVYGPARTAERMSYIHGLDGDDLGLTKRFTFQTLEPGHLVIGPFDVQLAHVNHPVETFAFRFSHGGRSLVYTGDTGETEAVPELAAGADVFLSEAAFLDGPGLPPDIHLTARQAGTYANRAGTGRLVLTHLVPGNSPDDARAEAASAYQGALDIAVAGQVIDLAG
jgi:ribonuclease BN (tRNA processing enzyme)